MSTHGDLGKRLFGAGRYREAAQHYKDAIGKDKDNAVWYSNRAMCWLKVEEWDAALQDCGAGLPLLEGGTRVKLLYRQGQALAGLGRRAEALASYQQVVELDPGNKAAARAIKELGDVEAEGRGEQEVVEIPITVVASLPKEYTGAASVGEPGAASADKTEPTAASQTAKPATAERDAVAQTIRSPAPSTPVTISRLVMLAKQSGDLRTSSYPFLHSISPATYTRLFATAGIEPEVLDLVLDAATTADIVLFAPVLEAISTLKRFDILAMMADASRMLAVSAKLATSGDPAAVALAAAYKP